MKKSNKQRSVATKLAQAMRFLDEHTGAVVPPIQITSTYARDENYDIRQPYWYKRDGNPTTEWAENLIADLEDGSDSLLFSSGMSAATAVIEHLAPNAHVVIPKVMYHGVLHQFQTYEERGRLRVSTYEAGNIDQLRDALIDGETALVWVETPNNPDWAVTDIRAAADAAHQAGAMLLTDCTATPPSMTKALDFGADISFHSATKYLNGHSDITAGVLTVREANSFWEEIALIRKLQGTVLQSFDAWLLIRGMRTLLLRVAQASENALKIATHFENDPRIEKVLYPGLPSHPGHEIAALQTGGQFGGMLSLIVKGTEAQAIKFVTSTEIFYPATSLGGVESLIEHRATVSGEGFPVHPALIRLSIGIEDADDLIDDLDQALDRAGL